MKCLILLLIGGCITFGSFAQQTNPFKSKPWEEYKKKRNLYQSPNPTVKPLTLSAPMPDTPREESNRKGVLKMPLKGRYMGSNGKGADIYAMTPDNMPCLVPQRSFRSNMPIAENNLPNAFKSPLKEAPTLPLHNENKEFDKVNK